MQIVINIPDEAWSLACQVLRQIVRTDGPAQPGPRPHRPDPDYDEPADVQRDPPRRPVHRADDTPGLEPQRPDRRNGSGGNGRGNQDGPPTNGRQFAGWIFKQPKGIQERAKEIVKSNSMSTRWTDLTDDDAKWLHHELTARQPEPSRNGWGGGH